MGQGSRPKAAPFSLDDDTERAFGPLSTDCRIWRWSKYPNGYGRIKLRGRATTAHRVFYELVRGPVPEGLVLDHLCCRKDCCNPWHLETVTSLENSAREWRSRRYTKPGRF